MTEPLKKADPQIVKEIAEEASALRSNRAFDAATKLLHRQWYGELIDPATTGEKLAEVAAKLRVLEAIPAMLDHLMADHAMNLRGQNARRHG